MIQCRICHWKSPNFQEFPWKLTQFQRNWVNFQDFLDWWQSQEKFLKLSLSGNFLGRVPERGPNLAGKTGQI